MFIWGVLTLKFSNDNEKTTSRLTNGLPFKIYKIQLIFIILIVFGLLVYIVGIVVCLCFSSSLGNVTKITMDTQKKVRKWKTILLFDGPNKNCQLQFYSIATQEFIYMIISCSLGLQEKKER